MLASVTPGNSSAMADERHFSYEGYLKSQPRMAVSAFGPGTEVKAAAYEKESDIIDSKILSPRPCSVTIVTLSVRIDAHTEIDDLDLQGPL